MYRHTPPTAIKCPRCKKQMPPMDPTSCDCGTWLSAFAAAVLLTAKERRQNHATRWWRVREPCPHCGDKMTLCNDEPGLLQGCEIHGYFIDADTVAATSLANGIDHAALSKARDDEARVEAHREQQLRDEQERDQEKREKAENEARIGRGLVSALTDEGRRIAAHPKPARREAPRSPEKIREERSWELEHALRACGEEVRAAVKLLETRVRELEADNSRLETTLRRLDERLGRIEERG